MLEAPKPGELEEKPGNMLGILLTLLGPVLPIPKCEGKMFTTVHACSTDFKHSLTVDFGSFARKRTPLSAPIADVGWF